jgi:hypothetical protein
VSIVGRALSPDFRNYAIDYGIGPNPATWTRVFGASVAVAGGELAKWDTTRIPDANLTLRLLVEDAKLGPLYYLFRSRRQPRRAARHPTPRPPHSRR